MFWIYLIYGLVLLALVFYLVIIIIRLLPLVIYVNQTLPFVPIPKSMAKALARLPALQSAKTIIDLGCGTGTLLAAVHRQLPQTKLTGVEFKASLVCLARWRTLFWKQPPQLFCQDMFRFNVSQYDAIVGWWIPGFGERLVKKFVQECKPGCVIICYMFPLPAHPQLIGTSSAVGNKRLFAYTKQAV